MNNKTGKWTPVEKEYLKEIAPGTPHKVLSEKMTDKFGLFFSVNQIKGALSRYKINTGRTGAFEKGKPPWNKGMKGLQWSPETQFKKGSIPHNHRPVGSERINRDGYVEIKIAEPKKWKHKHRILWEEIKGEIPHGHVIIFADGNRRNIVIENLMILSRRELAIANKRGLLTDDADVTSAGVAITKLLSKMYERKK